MFNDKKRSKLLFVLILSVFPQFTSSEIYYSKKGDIPIKTQSSKKKKSIIKRELVLATITSLVVFILIKKGEYHKNNTMKSTLYNSRQSSEIAINDTENDCDNLKKITSNQNLSDVIPIKQEPARCVCNHFYRKCAIKLPPYLPKDLENMIVEFAFTIATFTPSDFECFRQTVNKKKIIEMLRKKLKNVIDLDTLNAIKEAEERKKIIEKHCIFTASWKKNFDKYGGITDVEWKAYRAMKSVFFSFSASGISIEEEILFNIPDQNGATCNSLLLADRIKKQSHTTFTYQGNFIDSHSSIWYST